MNAPAAPDASFAPLPDRDYPEVIQGSRNRMAWYVMIVVILEGPAVPGSQRSR